MASAEWCGQGLRWWWTGGVWEERQLGQKWGMLCVGVGKHSPFTKHAWLACPVLLKCTPWLRKLPGWQRSRLRQALGPAYAKLSPGADFHAYLPVCVSVCLCLFTGVEPTYCMGDDIPLAVLSDKPHMLYDYFKQRFAQVGWPGLGQGFDSPH